MQTSLQSFLVVFVAEIEYFSFIRRVTEERFTSRDTAAEIENEKRLSGLRFSEQKKQSLRHDVGHDILSFCDLFVEEFIALNGVQVFYSNCLFSHFLKKLLEFFFAGFLFLRHCFSFLPDGWQDNCFSCFSIVYVSFRSVFDNRRPFRIVRSILYHPNARSSIHLDNIY